MKMSGLTTELKKESTVIINPLNQSELQSKLFMWKTLLSSCYGPRGKTIAVQNVIGGHVSNTKSSARIFELVRPSDPFVQLVISTVKNHLNRHSDFGKFCALLVLEIINCFEKIDLQPSVKAVAIDYFADIIKKHLGGDIQCCKMKVDLTNVTQIMNVLKPIFRSKLRITSTETEINFISSLLFETFLSLLPRDQNELIQIGHLHVIQQEGMSLRNSKLYSGFLHAVSSLPAIRLSNLKTKNKVALFNVSLAGDSSQINLSFEVTNSSSVEDGVLCQLFEIAKKLIVFEINVIACQKVVHPKLCKFFHKHDILVLQRLGDKGCRIFKDMSGCTPIGSLDAKSIYEECFGLIENIEIVSIFNKQYAHIKGSAATVILCNSNEESLKELNLTFLQGFHSLLTLLSNSTVFIGGGCLELHLSSIIKNQTSEDIKNSIVASRLGLNQGQLAIASKSFTTCLTNLARLLHEDECMPDCQRQKCFCTCGKKLNLNESVLKMDNYILDAGIAKLSAYATALEITSLLLRVGVCVIDKN